MPSAKSFLLLPLSLALAAALPAWASDVTVTGSGGSNGVSGNPGSNGGGGRSVSAINNPGPDATNSSTAWGGSGGVG